jgi:hypothetical protein
MAIGASALLVVWYGWFSLVTTSRAPDWPALTRHFPAIFRLDVDIAAVALAALLTCGFIATCVTLRRARHRGIALWVGGMATAWGLVALLWLPWIDHAKSYRGVYESLGRAIPADIGCVSSLDLGESERAILEYVLDIRAQDPTAGCIAALRQCRAGKVLPPVPSSWRLLWSGRRPGDDRDHFELWAAPIVHVVRR